MNRTNQTIGAHGEKIAETFLKSRDYAILDKNVKTPFGEIDIIAEKENCIVFIEVKTRSSERFGPPDASITTKKQKHIINNSLFYIKLKDLTDRDKRIDVIAITLSPDGELWVLKHIRNAIQM